MPVLARWIERAGIPTVTVTMMPDIAEALGAPRVVGVEFPFGHTFGMPGDRGMQRRVLDAALGLLDSASEPGARINVGVEWPQPVAEAYRAWQPREASPIVKLLLERLRASRS